MTLQEDIHQHAWPDESGEFHSALARLILTRESAGPGLRVSNVGGWHSEPDLHTWAGPAVLELFDRIRTDAQAIEAHALRVQAWANVMRAGSYQVAHRHGESVWSGVYYVDAGNGPGGAIKFARAHESFEIAPPAGLMVIFPGDLLHSVSEYAGSEARISVAFNLLK